MKIAVCLYGLVVIICEDGKGSKLDPKESFILMKRIFLNHEIDFYIVKEFEEEIISIYAPKNTF